MKILIFIIFLISSTAFAEIIFEEKFEDTNFSNRGWYDMTSGGVGTGISSIEHISGSTQSLECIYRRGTSGCEKKLIARLIIPETEIIYLTYHVKYSANWEGSNRGYHPHEFGFLTNLDSRWVGPAITHLTTYIEQNEGRPLIGLQDARNVDTNCILRNDDTFIGCNGDFNSYVFSENRSVASCNGFMGDLRTRECFLYSSPDNWYSARVWKADDIYFKDEPGTFYKNDWHRVEAMFQLNTIENGKGVANGKIRYWLDGNLLITSNNILLRTAQHPNMKFNQFIFMPYIGDGSPIDQTMWVDDITLSTHRIHSDDTVIVPPNPPKDFRLR